MLIPNKLLRSLLVFAAFIFLSSYSYADKVCGSTLFQAPVHGASFGLPSNFISPISKLPSGGYASLGNGLYRVSIDENRFRFFSAPENRGMQRQQNWCWAATIQMVLNYYGLEVHQEQIVHQVFGDLYNVGANPEQMVHGLSNWHFFSQNRSNVTQGRIISIHNAASSIFSLLANKKPVIVGLRGNVTGLPGHAYVMTGAEIKIDERGQIFGARSVTLIDPWPGSQREITIPWSEFSKDYQAALYLDAFTY